ncbi:MAG TPA: site-specific integrase [Thermoanaerobacterium sp.]|nr:site-specific integrase [Thermoanaerobacterium sp.]
MAKRRGHGEGSIFQRKDGRWAAFITTGRDAAGRQKKRWFYGKTRKEVQEQLTKVLAEAQQGMPIDPTKQTVGQFLTDWLKNSVDGVNASTTCNQYEDIVNLHIIPAIGDIPLTKLTPQHLQRLYKQKQEAGYRRVPRQCHAILHRALEQAAKWGLIPRNPADLVDAPRIKREEMKVFTPDEVDRFLDAAKNDRYYALYVLAVLVGLRQGELLGLKWDVIDFDAGTLQVCRQLQKVRVDVPSKENPGSTEKVWEWQFKEPKSAKSRRTINLPGLALAALKEHRKKQLEERLRLGDIWQDNGLVFCTEIGAPVDPSSLYRWSFCRVLQQAAVPKIRFHDLRHTCATLLLLQGVSPKVVQELLGHSSITITLDLYGHVLPSMKQAVVRAMDNLFPAKEEKKKRKARKVASYED